MLITYDFENLKDHITPEEVNGFFAKMKEVRKEEDYELSWNSGGADTTDSSTIINKKTNPFYVAIPVFILIGVAIWWTQRRA